MNISHIKAIEILDSRGNPTVRTFVTLDDGSVHSASVPSGASTGVHEALELRDGDEKRFGGKGVLKAVENVNSIIAQALKGQNISRPRQLDEAMCALDGTENKSKLGANAILSVSIAINRAAAHASGMPLWQYINEYYLRTTSYAPSPGFPRLMVNVVNGGVHANWNFDIQEFMVMPRPTKPTESIQMAAEIFHQLGTQIKARNLSTLVGDEGGYSPQLSSNEEVFELIQKAAEARGYKRDEDYTFAVDCAANEFFKGDMYHLSKLPHAILNSFQDLKNDKMSKQVQHDTNKYALTSAQLMDYYAQLGQKYHIQSFEDPFAQDDWEAFTKFTKHLSAPSYPLPALVVGDDLFVTNPKRIQKGIEKKAANAVLIKLNQIGSVAETIDAIQMAQNAGWQIAVSHRSGETSDAFIADLAYGVGADFIKTGSMSRSERLAKYNRLIEIQNEI